MGNDVQKCCRNCIKLDPDDFTLQTRFVQITSNSSKSLRCRRFYISSEPLQKQKVNELLIFTDTSLTMTIPNFNLKLTDAELQRLQQAVKYEIYNNNLVIKDNYFVLNAIQEQIDSEYGEFKDFASIKSENSLQKIQSVTLLKENDATQKQKLKNEIQQFALRNKSRAFRFKNPLKKYPIGQIIVAIVPLFEKQSDLNALKQAVEQGLSMSEDLKSIGVSQISFMLGYEQAIFQKIILQYILGYSRSRKEYVFKRMNEFIYLTRSQQQINNFFKFLNIYTKNNLEKIESLQTLRSEKDKKNIRMLGNKTSKKVQEFKVVRVISSRNMGKNGTDGQRMINCETPHQNQSFGNTSFHSYEASNLISFHQEKLNNLAQQNGNMSEIFVPKQFQSNLREASELGSKSSEDSLIKNIRIKSFKSKQSNVSDYF